MKVVKHMLSVLMDGIKDADMILDYAEEAEEEDMHEWSQWFKSHAEKRIDILADIYDTCRTELDLDKKIRENDPMASAFKCHIEEQMKQLRMRLADL